MGHRDDREAERARIDALEHDLAEANARAVRAEADARDARLERSTRTERGAAADRPESPPPVAAGHANTWAREHRRAYFGASFALSALGFVGLAAWNTASTSDRADELGWGVAVVVLGLGHSAIGRATRAPSAFSGVIVSVLSSSVVAGLSPAVVVGITALARLAPDGLAAVAGVFMIFLAAAVTARSASAAASRARQGD